MRRRVTMIAALAFATTGITVDAAQADCATELAGLRGDRAASTEAGSVDGAGTASVGSTAASAGSPGDTAPSSPDAGSPAGSDEPGGNGSGSVGQTAGAGTAATYLAEAQAALDAGDEAACLSAVQKAAGAP